MLSIFLHLLILINISLSLDVAIDCKSKSSLRFKILAKGWYLLDILLLTKSNFPSHRICRISGSFFFNCHHVNRLR